MCCLHQLHPSDSGGSVSRKLLFNLPYWYIYISFTCFYNLICPSGTNWVNPKLNFTHTQVEGFTEGLFNTLLSRTPKVHFAGVSAVVLVAVQNKTAGEKSSKVLHSDFVVTFRLLKGDKCIQRGGQWNLLRLLKETLANGSHFILLWWLWEIIYYIQHKAHLINLSNQDCFFWPP